MKRLIIPSLVMMMLASCNSCNNTTGTTDNPADSLCVDDTIVQIDAENNIDIQIKTLEDYKLFLYSYEPRHIYHENRVSVQWPIEGKGFDLKKLQDILLSHMNEFGEVKSPYEFVNKYANNAFAEVGYEWSLKEVSERTEDDNNQSAENDDEEDIMQYDTDCTFELKCDNLDKEHHLFTFCVFNCTNNGCGLGSCIYFGYDYIVFDYVKNKVITSADIFKDETAVIKELNKQRINEFGEEWEEGEIEGLPNIDSLPGSMYIVDNNVYFVFDKYEITYGAAGCPIVGMNVTKNPQLLTDYGKKMFNIK